MNDAARAILRNQIAIMRMSREHHCETALGKELRRRIEATHVVLFDPSTMCRCGLHDPITHTIETSRGGKIVCDLCDREVPGRQQYYCRNTDCKAASPNEAHCQCWHDQGTGPYPNARPGDGSEWPKTWRPRP